MVDTGIDYPNSDGSMLRIWACVNAQIIDRPYDPSVEAETAAYFDDAETAAPETVIDTANAETAAYFDDAETAAPEEAPAQGISDNGDDI